MLTFSRYTLLLLVSFSSISCCFVAKAEDSWSAFLGSAGNPVAAEQLPTEFSIGSDSDSSESKNVAWKVSLPGRAVSGPIVVDGKVITTSSSGMEERWLNVAAVDAESGKKLWHRSTKSTGRPFCHPTSANAAPTPCSDGKRVFAFYSSNDLVCYDLDGNLQWFKSLTNDHPLAGNDVGMAASPVVVDGVVVVSVECQADSFAAGVDAETGETLWEVSRPATANWASPRAVTDKTGKSVVVLHGSDELVALDPKSGSSAWKLEVSCSSVASSITADGKLYVPGRGVQALDVENAYSKPEKTWDTTRITPNSASLAATDVGLIGLNRTILVCCDDNGDRLWNARLEDAGQVWSTPVVAGNRLYVFSMTGKCFTVEFDRSSAKVVATSELGSEVLGTPAIAHGALYVRAVDSLWKIAKQD